MKYQLVLFVFALLIAPSILFSTKYMDPQNKKKVSKSKAKITKSKLKVFAGMNIGAIFKYIRKYDDFSKSIWGAFMNGFFMGVIEDVINEKTQVKCNEKKFWKLLQCFVGATDISLDQYYTKLKFTDYKNLPKNAEKGLVDIGDNAKSLLNESEVKQVLEYKPKTTRNSWSSYLKPNWESLSSKLGKILESVQRKFDEFWGKMKAFFESPLMVGVSSISNCVSPLNYEGFAGTSISGILKLVSSTWVTKFVEVVRKAPFIFFAITDMFVNLRTIVTKSYSVPQLKYYYYGKGVANILDTIAKIYNTAKKMKRFKVLFKLK